MQMKLETNLPVIFLTLLVISIVVIGYLELKKLHERIKVLEYNINKEKKKENKPEKVKTMDNVVPDIVPPEGKSEIVPENKNRIEEWQMNNEKENIINTLNRKEEYIEEINNEEEQQMSFLHEGGMYIQQPMMFKTMVDDTDDIIEQIRNDEDINFENINEEEEMFNKLNEDTKEDIIDEHKNEPEIDIEEKVEIENENEDDNVSHSEKSISENDESGEEINLKEINEEDDFSKSKIVVDETYSVNNLKTICKNLGLPLSGNKTTLINRIMDNQ